MSNSFYGGRDGQPFVIKATFKTVQAMADEFKRGPEYTAVNFGEYALIETEHKNNPENGRIFRRGYDYSKKDRYISSWELNASTNIFNENAKTEAGGAIYVGQIVGPSGNAPHFISLPTHLPKLDEEGRYIYQTDSDGNFILDEHGKQILEYEEKPSDYSKILTRYKDYDIRSGEGIFSVDNSHLVPGKIDAENFNDNITWRYCSVRDENQQETNAYIGFTFPYTVIEFEAVSVDPYYNRTDGNKNEEEQRVDFGHDPLVEGRTDTLDHPFYEKWKISIPRGVRGMSIENIGIATTTEEIGEVYAFDFIDKNAENSRDTNTGLLKIKDYPGKDEDKSGSRQIMYCTVVDYDRVAAGDKYKIYLGNYNMIKDISLTGDGIFTIKYTHEKDYVRNGADALNWLTGLNLTDGKLTMTTNNDNLTNIDEQLHWPVNIYIDPETGAVTYTDVEKDDEGNNITSSQDGLQWVKDIDFAQDGSITTSYTNKSDRVQSKKLQWATNIQIASNGQVSTSYNDGTSVDGPKLDWIKSAILDEENNLKIDYVNAKDIKVQLKTLNRVELDGNTLYGYYNTAPETRVSLGDTELGLSACVATEEEGPPSELRVGGLWFVADRKFGASS